MNLALNPFDKGRKPEKIEEIVVTDNVKKFMEMYKEWRRVVNCFPSKAYDYSVGQLLVEYDVPVYSPGELTILSKVMTSIGDTWAGTLLSCMMNRAVKEGHKDFYLIIENPVDHLCAVRNANVEVIGNVGKYFGSNCRESRITLRGDAGIYFANDASLTEFYVEGSISEYFGYFANYNTFEITGMIHGLEKLHESSHNTLILHDPECYDKMRLYHRPDFLGNRVLKKEDEK